MKCFMHEDFEKAKLMRILRILVMFYILLRGPFYGNINSIS